LAPLPHAAVSYGFAPFDLMQGVAAGNIKDLLALV